MLTDGINVLDVCLETLIDGYSTTVVDSDADVVETKAVKVGAPANADKENI